MANTLTTRTPPRLRQKPVSSGNAYALAADLIPKRGAGELQSDSVRKLARAAFRGARAR